MNATTFTLTPDQQNAYNLLTAFLTSTTQREFILLGSAGTGKTALITKFIRDNKQLRMVISAPTHQALGVAKSKLLGDGNLKLKTINMQTIQSLLGYTQYYNKDGSKFFAKGKHPKSWKEIDIVLVDECSMLTNQIIDDIRDRCNKQNTKHIKVIYIGDPAQLPPVNQPTSKLFREIADNTACKIELTQIVRTNNNNIIGLSQTHRNWIFGEDIRKNVPKLKEHLCTNIQMFNFRTEVTKWLDTFVEKTKSQVGNANIILAWTNSAVDAHNDYVRNKLFNKENLQKYEDGEIVIFIDYFRVKLPPQTALIASLPPIAEENTPPPADVDAIVEAKGKKAKDNFISFHASEQVRVLSSMLSNQKLPFFKEYKSDSLDAREIKMNVEFAKLIDLLNATVCDKEYKIYTINITKINQPSNITFTINTFKDKWDAKQLINSYEEAIRTTTDTIYDFIKKEQCDAPTKAKLIEYMEKKINGIRKYFDENIIGHIATIGYGYAITVHKSQGTTFGDVFIDVFDICQNTDRVEMAKCLYTSFTRASGELFILG